MDGLPFEHYGSVLGTYLRTRDEQALYEASLLSHTFVEQGAGPDEIVALHFEALDQILRGIPYREHIRAVGDAHQFLLEIMIAYGVKYREYLELRVQQHSRDQEAREEILAMIAHELRSPIAAAQVNLDLATRNLSKGRVERVTPLIGTAKDALARLSRLTANLVRSGKASPFNGEFFPLNLTALVDEACQWAEPTMEEKGLTLVRDEPGASAVEICGDPDALLSVFGNLLSNAIRYTPAGGTVTVRQGLSGQQAWVEVSDTGIGMSPEIQARAFDRFFRAPEARAVEAQGLGVGLTLVKDAMTAHGGEVSLKSELGVGTTFRVTLPVVSGPCGESGDLQPVGGSDEATRGNGADTQHE